jgi:hypothetical protein
MPIGLVNPKDYINNPNSVLNFDEIGSGYGTDRAKLMITIIISYIAFNFFVNRIPVILDSIKGTAKSPDSREDDLISRIEQVYLDINNDPNIYIDSKIGPLMLIDFKR